MYELPLQLQAKYTLFNLVLKKNSNTSYSDISDAEINIQLEQIRLDHAHLQTVCNEFKKQFQEYISNPKFDQQFAGKYICAVKIQRANMLLNKLRYKINSLHDREEEYNYKEHSTHFKKIKIF